MRQIVNSLAMSDPIAVEDVVLADTYIAYVTFQGRGMAVLKYDDANDMWGFVYLHHCLTIDKYNYKASKYQASTSQKAIEKVMKAGREIYMFSSVKELLAYYLKRTKSEL